VEGIGTLLPPTDLADLVERHPRFFGRVAAVDRRAAKLATAAWLSDHYLLTLERR
jgi:hypothetical protein